MTYSLTEFESGKWLFRFFSAGMICGKLCLVTADKDNFKTDIDARGWTEFTE
jgi:hypothetical protein